MKHYIVVALILILFGCGKSMPMPSDSAKYKFGMTLAEAHAKMTKVFPVKETAIDYENEPTKQQLEEDAKYAIDVEDEGVVLWFNHDKRLIRIQSKDKK
jgi:hypothetical protein